MAEFQTGQLGVSGSTRLILAREQAEIAISAPNRDRMHEETLTIEKAFESGDIDAAKEATIKLKYLEGIKKSIQEKLQGM